MSDTRGIRPSIHGARRGARLLLPLLLAACVEPGAPALPSERVPERATVLLVVGDAAALNASESGIVARLRQQGYVVAVHDDEAVTDARVDGHAVVIVSKTSQSALVGRTFRTVHAGVVFWEDNAQAPSMMATIDDATLLGTAWHARARTVAVDPAAPPALRAGLAGAVAFYTLDAEMTYAPKTPAGAQTLGPGAIRVAEFATVGSGLWTIYAYDAGGLLADGTAAAGRRVYFGLYDDTHRLLTTEGLALFDAAVAWAAERPGRPHAAGVRHRRPDRVHRAHARMG